MLRMVALAVLLLSAAPAAHARDILTIGVNDVGSYPYIASRGATLADPPGLAIELLQEVAGPSRLPRLAPGSHLRATEYV